MITFRHVTKNYSTNVGLEDISVSIADGDFVFIVGPSGAGKSTFIKLILKEIDCDRGTIRVGDYVVSRLSNRQIPGYRRKIGTVFQDFRLLPKKTVFENVAFAMEVVHKSQRQIKKQVPQVLALVGISDKASKYPGELSAGEQQRVAIARAIVNNPQVLIADEPTGNLDPDTAWEIMDLIEQINMRGTTVVMVTHAKDIVDRMHKRVITIEAGHVVRDEQGTYESGNYFEEDEVEAAPESEEEDRMIFPEKIDVSTIDMRYRENARYVPTDTITVIGRQVREAEAAQARESISDDKPRVEEISVKSRSDYSGENTSSGEDKP